MAATTTDSPLKFLCPNTINKSNNDSIYLVRASLKIPFSRLLFSSLKTPFEAVSIPQDGVFHIFFFFLKFQFLSLQSIKLVKKIFKTPNLVEVHSLSSYLWPKTQNESWVPFLAFIPTFWIGHNPCKLRTLEKRFGRIYLFDTQISCEQNWLWHISR